MDTLRLAWRSFIRHRRRSALTGAMIALGLAMMLIFVGMADDGHARLASMGIRMGAGHVVVQGRGFQDAQTLDHLVTDAAAAVAAARDLPHVAHVVPRVRAGGFLSSGESSAAVLVSGVDPVIEAAASDIPAPRRRVAGGYLRRRAELPHASQPADIYLGVELARNLHVEVDDRVVLTLSPPGAAGAASAAYQVRGVFRTGVAELDSAWAEIPLEEAQAQLGLGARVTQVALVLDDLDATAGVAAALERRLGDPTLEVLPWQVALHELYDAIRLDDLGLYLMMIIIFVIVAAGIFNTVMMSVVERTRELGVMMAIGTSAPRLFAQIILESGVLAVVASLAGLLVGLALHALVARHGIDITRWAENYEIAGVIYEGRIYSLLSVAVVVRWTLVVMGLVVVSALYPAYRVTRLRPVEAMRHA